MGPLFPTYRSINMGMAEEHTLAGHSVEVWRSHLSAKRILRLKLRVNGGIAAKVVGKKRLKAVLQRNKAVGRRAAPVKRMPLRVFMR